MIRVAALYVAKNGVYFDPELTDVDPWDEQRDARNYRGPWPVVAHPPCARWGRYWHGGPNSASFPRERRHRGDDDGCFAHALWSVRTFGGVIEHPEASSAWEWFGIESPLRTGGWRKADRFEGWTCCVEQGHYGHRSRKATWIYAVGCEIFTTDIAWGPSEATAKLDEGFHSAQERAAARGRVASPVESLLSKSERIATPIPFRDLLLDLARSCGGAS